MNEARTAKSNKDAYFVIFIFFFAFIFRLAYLFFLKKNYFFFSYPSSDVNYYLNWANEIDANGWLGDKPFWGLPLYPYFLVIIKRISLGSFFLMRVINILIGSLNCVLAYSICRSLFPKDIRIARLTGILTLTNFILIYYDCLMMPVALLIMLSLIIILTLLSFNNKTRFHEWLLLGILIGLACLGDGKFILLAVMLLTLYLVNGRFNISKRLAGIILPLGIGILIILSAVTLRNRIITGDWFFISAQSGLSFYAGNNLDSNGIFESPELIRPSHKGQDQDQIILSQAETGRELLPGEVSNFWRRKALRFIHDNPAAFLRLLRNKFFLFFTQHEGANDLDLILQRRWRIFLDINPFYIICPFALLGIILTRNQYRGTTYVNLVILSQLAFTLIFFLTTRHRATILPLLLIYQSFALVWVFEKIKRADFRAVGATLAILIIFILIFRPRNIDKKTFNFILHTKYGNVYEIKKAYAKAKKHYEKALILKPNNSIALYNVGNMYLLQDKPEKASSFYLKALKFSPYNVDALYNLGYSYELQGEFGLALDYFSKVISRFSDSPDAHFHIADIYIKKGKCRMAAPHIQALRAFPEYDHITAGFISHCE